MTEQQFALLMEVLNSIKTLLEEQKYSIDQAAEQAELATHRAACKCGRC